MSPYSKSQRADDRLIIVVIIAAPLLAILASLWPVEPAMLAMACIVLAFATLSTFPFVRSLRLLFARVTTLAVLLSVITSNWPLRAAFALSRTSFDRIAAQVLAENPPETPCMVGLFRIEKAHVDRHGIVCLWTDIDPSGATGFVQYRCDDLPFNLWSRMRLDDSWQFIQED